MPLTPFDIEQKTFATAFKGYDLAEVDDFLDEVISTIRDLEEKVVSAGSTPSPVQSAPVESGPVDESAVGRALVAAQTMADQILEEARAAAEQIRAEAVVEAEQLKSAAAAEAESLESEKSARQAEARKTIADLGERVDSVRRELAALVGTLADGIDEMDSVISGAESMVADDEVELPDREEDDDEFIEDEDEPEYDSDDSAGSDDDGSDDDDDDDDDGFESWQLGPAVTQPSGT